MNKVYACSDLHGMKELYNKISDFLDNSDIVYFLGDAGDRGPDPWEMIKLIRNDERFIYIKGNHEDMLAAAMSRYPAKGQDFSLLRMNGGEDTLNGWIEEGADKEWVKYLDNLPAALLYTNRTGTDILLCHAGCTPWYNEEKDTLELPYEEDLIWDRYHFDDNWHMDEDLIVVHGHTPQTLMGRYLNEHSIHKDGITIYCDGHKINIDNGAFFTRMTVLLDLDTFETHKFYCDDLFA